MIETTASTDTFSGGPFTVPPAIRSVPHLILAAAREHGSKTALVGKPGSGVVLTYEDLGRAVEETALGFEAVGVRPGERVGILSYNRPEWAICDLAIMSLGAVSVPIHHVMSPAQVRYVLRDAEVKALVVENPEQMAKVEAARGSALRQLIALEPLASPTLPTVSFEALRARGRARREERPGTFEGFLEALDPAAPCSIVYTSGTSADPKGVLLCHRGFVTVALASESVLNLHPHDVFLSHLPLSHLYERVAGHWCPLYRGCTIAYARDVRAVVEDLARVRPTVMVSVPLVYEKMRERVEAAASRGGRWSESLFRRAIAAGRAYRRARAAGRGGLALAAANAAAEALVFRRVRKRLGGRFRFPISGGAPLSVETLAFFEAMGFPIVEGYGMTETHLIISLTPPGGTRHGSCGRPIPGVAVRIAGDGEVLVRGDTLMLGYLGKDDATHETIDGDGWLHTGDIGRLDGDGFLYITDRKKNIIVNAGGKNIAPAPIENAIRASRYIDDVCVVGDRRAYLVALVVPDFEALATWARERGLDASDRVALVAHPDVCALVMEEIRARQGDTPAHERVRKCHLLAEPFSIERGELTATLKLRRKAVEENRREAIERLYAADPR